MRAMVDFDPHLFKILSENRDLETFRRHGHYDKTYLRYADPSHTQKLSDFNKTNYVFYFDFSFRGGAFLGNVTKQNKLKKFNFFEIAEKRIMPIWHHSAVTTNYNIITPWMLFHRAHHFLTILSNYDFGYYYPGFQYLKNLNYQFYQLLINTKSTRANWDYIPPNTDCNADIFSACVGKKFKIKTQDQIQELINFLQDTPKFRGMFNPFLDKNTQDDTKQNIYYGKHNPNIKELQKFVEFPQALKTLLSDMCYRETSLLLQRQMIINLIMIAIGSCTNFTNIIKKATCYLWNVMILNYNEFIFIEKYHDIYQNIQDVNNPDYVELNIRLFFEHTQIQIMSDMLVVLNKHMVDYFQSCQQYGRQVLEFVQAVKIYQSQLSE